MKKLIKVLLIISTVTSIAVGYVHNSELRAQEFSSYIDLTFYYFNKTNLAMQYGWSTQGLWSTSGTVRNIWYGPPNILPDGVWLNINGQTGFYRLEDK